MTTAAQTSLLDQAQAASTQAASIFANFARQSADIRYEVATGASAIVLRRLETALIAGTLTYCPHTSRQTMQPLVWAAWRPGRLRCYPCAGDAARAIKGTPEDRRCDACHRVNKTIIPVWTQLPALVNLAALESIGPIAMTFGLCRACHDTTTEAAADD